MRRLVLIGFLAAVAMLLLGGSSAMAVTLGFDCISNNLAGDCAIGSAQLQVEALAGPGANQVSFTFTNTDPDPNPPDEAQASSITAVYFDDDGDPDPLLLSIASILNGTGVDFDVGANPPNVPAGNGADPDFDNTGDLDADAEPPTQPNGVNPNETLTIIANLTTGTSFADVEAALADGSLRIAIHVQGFATGGSESFVNDGEVVPEPSLGLLLAGPLIGLIVRSRRR
jgi:hypothetical protein